MKNIIKVTCITIVALLLVAVCFYCYVLNFPKLKSKPRVGVWYKVTNNKMKESDGGKYRAFFKKGKENKVIVYFSGGGVSIDESTADSATYIKKTPKLDYIAKREIDNGGIAANIENNPFKDWSFIIIPYVTGDFHTGTGELKYKDEKGEEKILYHNGYINYSETMKKIIELTDVEKSDTVLVTGYSAGGFGASLLADDVFTNYFPNAKSKNVLIDSALCVLDNWHDIAENIWKSPKSILDNIKTENIVLDNVRALRDKYGENINILFDSSTRDGSLAQYQNFFDNYIFDANEYNGDNYQMLLKSNIQNFKDLGVYLFIWDGYSWYGNPNNLTKHTIIGDPLFYTKIDSINVSISEWLYNSINGNPNDYGLDLIDKEYSKTTIN